MQLRPMCFVGLNLGLILSSAVQQPAPHSARRPPAAASSLSKKSKWLKRWQKPVRLKGEKEAIERLARSKPRTESVVV